MPTLEIIKTPACGIRVTREDGDHIDLHPLWLRERCQGPTSIDSRSRQRIIDISALPPDLSIKACRWLPAGELLVLFSDGHESRFDRTELLAQATTTPTHDGLPSLIPWTAELINLPEASWTSMRDPLALRTVAGQFIRWGFVILHDVPCTDLKVCEIAATFGALRETQFGRLIDMRSVSDVDEIAHSPLHAASHTDFPYRMPVPGIQFLHCLRNRTTEEWSTLVDGLALAQALRDTDSLAFEILTTLNVQFCFSDANHTLVAWRPHIRLDCRGRFQAIHLSAGLDFAPPLASGELSKYYEAKRMLSKMANSPEFVLPFRLEEGDLLMLDNQRLLHGGTSFDPQRGELHHQYCYIDADGLLDLYRRLGRAS